MEERFKRETQGLIRSWEQYDQEWLRDYLVADVEDPRINVQSVLTRHFLIEQLFGDRYDQVTEQELRFALVTNWVLKLLKGLRPAEQLRAALDALLTGSNGPQELDMPKFVSDTFTALDLPNYICDLLATSSIRTSESPIIGSVVSTFQEIWCELLADEQPECVSVLEPGCGSANDYRFIDAFGIGPLLDYTGFDLSQKNVLNAKQMFPEVHFELGNVLEINSPEKAFDFCFVHDLFEHLSIEAMEIAIAELCRVTRQGICVGFFNMHDIDQHVVKVVGDYHWNNLSMAGTRTVFQKYASAVQVIDIEAFLTSHFGRVEVHNKGAHTFIVTI